MNNEGGTTGRATGNLYTPADNYLHKRSKKS